MSSPPTKKPNFFIIGAPKCGTSSLWAWLRSHPGVFFPRFKEPNFFNFDHYRGGCRTLKDYESLFHKAQPWHRAIGDATPAYLRSRTAIPAITDYVNQAKIVVSIRHPVDMALSLHHFQFLLRNENVPDFWTAWKIQKQRRYGAHRPRRCDDIRNLWYADICSLGSQLKRVYDQIPKDRIHVIQLENVKSDPLKEYRRLLGFLGLKQDDRDHFPIVNEASNRRFKSLWSIYKLMDQFIRDSGIKMPRTGLMQNIDNRTRKPADNRATLTASQRAELVDYFRNETRLAEQASGLDLEHWRQ